VPITVETRPIYLEFTADRFAGEDGALFVGNPPLRGAGDLEALWAGLASGTVDMLGSDHAPWMRAEKLDPRRDVSSFRPGMPDLETMLPLLFSEGVLTGRLSMERFVAVTSSGAARVFGLAPAKGGIRVGGDADLVVWDPERTRVVRAVDGQSKADWSLYEDRAITGWPVVTVSRGRVVVEDGEVVEDGAPGRAVVRATH
jgi:dihydropyrimidinase